MISLTGNISSEMPVSPVLGTFKLGSTSELAVLHLKPKLPCYNSYLTLRGWFRDCIWCLIASVAMFYIKS